MRRCVFLLSRGAEERRTAQITLNALTQARKEWLSERTPLPMGCSKTAFKETKLYKLILKPHQVWSTDGTQISRAYLNPIGMQLFDNLIEKSSIHNVAKKDEELTSTEQVSHHLRQHEIIETRKHELTTRVLSPSLLSTPQINELSKNSIRQEFHDADAQEIAILTMRIHALAEHIGNNDKDKWARVALRRAMENRKLACRTLKNKNILTYFQTLKDCGIHPMAITGQLDSSRPTVKAYCKS